MIEQDSLISVQVCAGTKTITISGPMLQSADFAVERVEGVPFLSYYNTYGHREYAPIAQCLFTYSKKPDKKTKKPQKAT